MKIRAAVLRKMGLPQPYTQSLPLSIEELELAEPADTEIRVQIKAAGLCHSDLSAINGSRKRIVPLAMGHEACGIVDTIGSKVKGLQRGDHVVMSFTPMCGHCSECSTGHAELCGPGQRANAACTLLDGATRLTTPSGEKIYHHLGVSGFATYAVVMPESVVKIDPSIPWKHAALFGCGIITGVGAVVNTAKVTMGTTVAIVGLGGVGLSAVLGARASGARRIIAVDMKESKLKLALEMGATDVVNASEVDAVAKVRELTDGGVDFAFEMAGVVPALDSAVRMTRRGGTTTTAGLPPTGKTLPVDVAALVGEERKLQGSYMGSCVFVRDIPRYITMFREGRLPVDKLLSGIVKFEDINEGFDKLAHAEVIRQIILFD